MLLVLLPGAVSCMPPKQGGEPGQMEASGFGRLLAAAGPPESPPPPIINHHHSAEQAPIGGKNTRLAGGSRQGACKLPAEPRCRCR